MLQTKNKHACLSLSGGLDSTTLLLNLLAKGYQVNAISFLYGQKHDEEIECAKELVRYLGTQSYPVKHSLITLNGLENLLFSTLTKNGGEIPEGHYSEENMLATVVPNRNKIFISILQSVALSIALQENDNVLVAMGIHSGDYKVYPDTRKEFIDLDYQAYLSGNWNGEKVVNYLPYLNFTKYEILQDGVSSCNQLSLDFDEIYKRTLTSYKPNSAGISDYKSGASVARIEAFIKLNRQDPVLYADESGIVDWEVAKQHVLQILKNQ